MDDGSPLTQLIALGSPIRFSLFERLLDAGTAGRSPSSLADAAGLERNLVSYHLRPLVASGLVSSTRNGRDVTYSVSGSDLERLALRIHNMRAKLP